MSEHQRQTREIVSADGGSLTVSFLVTTRHTLIEGFMDAVHDEALAAAHRGGFIPSGVPLVNITPAEPTRREEGVRGWGSIEDLAIENAILQGNLAQVTVEYIEWTGFL